MRRLAFDLDRTSHRYEPLPDGARIRYAAAEARLVRAIHVWFAAQTRDHGPHAPRS